MAFSLIPFPRFKITIVTDISIFVSTGKGFYRFSESFSVLSHPEILYKKFSRHYQRLSYIHNKHSACTYNAYQLFKCNLNYIDVKLLTCAYFFDVSKFFILYFLASIYLTYLTRAVIGWLSVFYQRTKRKAQLKRFASLYNIRPFSGRHSSFIFVN